MKPPQDRTMSNFSMKNVVSPERIQAMDRDNNTVDTDAGHISGPGKEEMFMFLIERLCHRQLSHPCPNVEMVLIIMQLCQDDSGTQLIPAAYESQMKKLSSVLMGLGGISVASEEPDRDLEKVLARGHQFAIEGRRFVPGQANQCHQNVARMYLDPEFRTARIATGYGLSVDGTWLQHSWLIHGGKIVETTVPFEVYYGCELSDDESILFCLSSSVGTPAVPECGVAASVQCNPLTGSSADGPSHSASQGSKAGESGTHLSPRSHASSTCGKLRGRLGSKCHDRKETTMSKKHVRKANKPVNIRIAAAEAIKSEPLYAAKPLAWFVGRLVKMAFTTSPERTEHMWVAVTGVEGESLVGTLGNDSLFGSNFRKGDRVVLDRTEIEAVDLTWEEWREEADALKAQDDYSNPKLGEPELGSGFEKAYQEGLTPRQALERWRLGAAQR